MQRIAAHIIDFEGKIYKMSVIELADDGKTVSIFPLTREIHSTTFISGKIRVKLVDARLIVSQ